MHPIRIRCWRQLRYAIGAANNGWNQWVLNYTPQRQRGVIERLHDRCSTGAAGACSPLLCLLLLLAGKILAAPPGNRSGRCAILGPVPRLGQLGLPRAPTKARPPTPRGSPRAAGCAAQASAAASSCAATAPGATVRRNDTAHGPAWPILKELAVPSSMKSFRTAAACQPSAPGRRPCACRLRPTPFAAQHGRPRPESQIRQGRQDRQTAKAARAKAAKAAPPRRGASAHRLRRRAGQFQRMAGGARLRSTRWSPHGFDRARWTNQMRQVRFIDSAVQLVKPAPPGKPKNWQAYSERFIEPIRINAGVRFWNENAAALARAEATYGVPAEIIVGIIGVETIYGRDTGRFRVLDTLTTLAFAYPEAPNRNARMAFFRSELENTLLLARKENIDPFSLLGSFAGAVGMPQFMPGNILKYGVDFDGDGTSTCATRPRTRSAAWPTSWSRTAGTAIRARRCSRPTSRRSRPGSRCWAAWRRRYQPAELAAPASRPVAVTCRTACTAWSTCRTAPTRPSTGWRTIISLLSLNTTEVIFMPCRSSTSGVPCAGTRPRLALEAETLYQFVTTLPLLLPVGMQYFIPGYSPGVYPFSTRFSSLWKHSFIPHTPAYCCICAYHSETCGSASVIALHLSLNKKQLFFQ
jgi:membrane-bound lytic murein transglycosylase B